MNLDEVRGNAWSFPNLRPPEGSKLIGTEIRGKETYFYYLSEDGKYYFETLSGYAFKAKMAEAQRRHKEEKRRQRKSH